MSDVRFRSGRSTDHTINDLARILGQSPATPRGTLAKYGSGKCNASESDESDARAERS
jgi:hypothetical protein